MIFSELYGAYYNAVSAILKESLKTPITTEKIVEICLNKAFKESFVTIEKALTDGEWKLLGDDKTAVVKNVPDMPLTTLQKRWIKAISQDPRIKLFGETLPDFPGVEPLFSPDDVCVFDRCSDGDDYTDEEYIKRFRLIKDAVKNGYPLKFVIRNRKNQISEFTAKPEYIEYSEKDDKFRVITVGCRYGETINIGRIISCEKSDGRVFEPKKKKRNGNKKVTFEIIDERDALERVLLHFAHFAKEAEKTGDNSYRVTVEYAVNDETEMVIRILSFGPMIKVISPDGFIDLIKRRLSDQKKYLKSCEL